MPVSTLASAPSEDIYLGNQKQVGMTAQLVERREDSRGWIIFKINLFVGLHSKKNAFDCFDCAFLKSGRLGSSLSSATTSRVVLVASCNPPEPQFLVYRVEIPLAPCSSSCGKGND